MKEWWEKHRAKIWAVVLGALSMIGSSLIIAGGQVLCNKLPAPFSSICTGTAQEIAQQIRQPGTQPTFNEDAGTVTVTVSLDVCPDSLCLSNGYQLPMPDGGHCACPKPQ